jgi:deoxyribonucleoside regulator
MEGTSVHSDRGSGTRAAAAGVDLAKLVRVSRLYYELGETQDEIARRLGVTRPHVSKLLKQAREAGVVEIRIVDQLEPPGDLAATLAGRFDRLGVVHLAPTFSGSDGLTRRRVGRLAAEVLVGALRNGLTVGIGDGAAITATADALGELATPIDATVVPLCGGFWSSQTSREPYRRIADALGATARGLLAPGLLEDEATRDALAAHVGIRAVTDLWSQLDVAAFGIGSRSWSEASVGPAAFAELEAERAIGEVLIAPYDLEGRFVGSSIRRRAIAFDARRLPQVPVTIGIASGPGKVEPILGALRAGIVGTLVTDSATAAAVLAMDLERPTVAGHRSPVRS